MKKSGWNIFGTLILAMIFGSMIIDNLLPIIVGLAVIGAIGVLSSKYSDSHTQTTRTRRTTYTAGRRRDISASDEARVNVYLRKYFQLHDRLQISEQISLQMKSSNGTPLSNLEVYENGRYVCGFDAFRNRYPGTYSSILKELVRLSAQPVEEPETVIDAEVTEHTEEAPKKKEKDSQYYMETITALNVNIPDEEISNGLYETTALLKQIHDLEERFPDSKDKLDKLYEYYLPILTRILKQYENLQNAKTDPSYGETKEKLKKTIGLINEAMKTIISGMTDRDFINLSADMSTLEAVLQKDGLAQQRPFEQKSEGGNGHA